jgi:hypothetical protein
MSSESKGPRSSGSLRSFGAGPREVVEAGDRVPCSDRCSSGGDAGLELAEADKLVGACSESIRGPEDGCSLWSTEGVGDCRRNCWQSDQTLWKQQKEQKNRFG